MATIFMSMSGEGRGHASRARALTEGLRARHRMVLFAPGDAFQFLAPIYAGTAVQVRRLPALRFQYDRSRRLDSWATLREGIHYLKELPSTVRHLRDLIDLERPSLVISDFEPALPRAARLCSIPFLSINHQHFLRTFDLSGLPLSLRLRAWIMGWFVGLYASGQAETVVSSFYSPPLKRSVRNVTQVGALMRPEVLAEESKDFGHLTAYFRKFAPEKLLHALADQPRPVHVFGLGPRPPMGSLTFRRIDAKEFIMDLATCTALVSTAGNQLLGEALYLGKPALVVPEERNHEQYINAHFVRQMGVGDWCESGKAGRVEVDRFLKRLAEYRTRIDRQKANGLPAVVKVVERHLEAPLAANEPVLPVVPALS